MKNKTIQKTRYFHTEVSRVDESFNASTFSLVYYTNDMENFYSLMCTNYPDPYEFKDIFWYNMKTGKWKSKEKREDKDYHTSYIDEGSGGLFTHKSKKNMFKDFKEISYKHIIALLL